MTTKFQWKTADKLAIAHKLVGQKLAEARKPKRFPCCICGHRVDAGEMYRAPLGHADSIVAHDACILHTVKESVASHSGEIQAAQRNLRAAERQHVDSDHELHELRGYKQGMLDALRIMKSGGI